MARRDRRAFTSDARRYLISDPDGRASVAAAAQWLGSIPLTRDLSDAQRRKLVITLRSEDRVIFVADHVTNEITLAEFDGAALNPLTILSGLARL
jgi:hypothetical protein